MNEQDNGGPAFPVFPETSAGHASAFQGMTLRDYFAAKAMQGLCERYGHDSDIARNSYELADAMLRARG